jgi:hypothetical protein
LQESRSPITDNETMAIVGHAMGEVGKIESPDDFKASLFALSNDIALQQEALRRSYTGSAAPGYKSRPLDQPAQETQRTALAGYRKLFAALEAQYPDASVEELLDRMASNLYESHSQSPTSEEFISRTMAQSPAPPRTDVTGPPQPPAVQSAESTPGFPTYEPGLERPPFRPLTTMPRDVPRGTLATPPMGQMGPAERMAVRARSEQAHPYEPTASDVSFELAQRGVEISPYARGARPGGIQGVGRFRKPQPAPKERQGPPLPEPGVKPAAFDKYVQAAKDQYDITAGDVSAMFSRKDVKRQIPEMIDGADNAAAQHSLMSSDKIRVRSMKDVNPALAGRAKEQAVKAEKAEAEMRRKAAIPYIASGKTDNQGNWTSNKSLLVSWRAKLDLAEARARTWSQDVNPLKRREGRKDLEYIEDMRAAIDYADEHWSDRTFVEGAQEYRKQVHEAIQFENANGATTVERDNYIPGLFQGDYYAGKRLLGTQYRMPKKFQNPYDAIKAGPYRLASQDVADLAQTRILTGRRAVERSLWIDSMKGLRDPVSRKPIAVEPVLAHKSVIDKDTGEEIKEPVWQSPSADYELVRAREGSKPMAVLGDANGGYHRLVRKLIRPSVIEDLPGGKEGLAVNGALKHGVLLLLDTFHLARLNQYALAATGYKGRGWRGGLSALSYDAATMPEAVRKGLISQAAADWALEPVDLNIQRRVRNANNTGWTTAPGTVTTTRKAIADQLLQSGLNAAKISDALYKDAVQNIPILGEPYHKLISPYNKFLFDRFLPGVMLEGAVRNFERYNKSHPSLSMDRLASDVVRDTNMVFGNMGRQGIFKSATFRDLAQLVMLAPMWQEGLLRKELAGASRIAALPLRAAAGLMGKSLPYRQDLPALGVTGRMMASGLATYFVLTQLVNLAFRHKFTWDNEEEGHKMDAFIPVGDKGVWLSPLSVFAETTHDVIRLGETKPQVMDRLVQMGENRLGPVGKMANVLWTGKAPTGEQYTTTGGRVWGGVSQVVPFAGASPISFSTPARAIGSKIAPGMISPPPPGALPRQLASTLFGVKMNTGQTASAQVFRMADEFMRKEGLKKETGWQQVLTDDPSYTQLRRQLRSGDLKGASNTYQQLLKGHSDKDIIKAMRLWAKHPFTRSSNHNEQMFQQSLSDKELDMYTRANEERQQELERFYDFINSQP